MSGDTSDCTCERFSAVSFFRVDDPSCPFHHPIPRHAYGTPDDAA